MSRARWASYLAASLALVPALASAEDAPKPADSAPAKAPTSGTPGDDKTTEKKPTNTGGYSWSEAPRRGRRHTKRAPGTPLAAFPAFRALADGTSQISVTVSKKVEIAQHKAAGRVVFVLRGAEIAVRNNSNTLVMSHFGGAVSRARLVPHKGGAQLILELREPVEITQRVTAGPRGSMTLILGVPKPSKDWSGQEAGRGVLAADDDEARPKSKRAKR